MDIMTTTQKTEEEISTANQNVIQPEQSVITQPAVTTKQTKKPVSYNLKEYERNPGEDIFSYIERVGQENIDKYNANVDRYAVYLNPEDYEEINDLVNINPNATPEERDAERYKIASAMKYSKYYDIPLDEAYKNIEQFNYSIFGPNHENYTKGFFKSLVDSLSLGQNTLEMGMIGSQIRDARSKGDTETVERLSQIYNKMKSENELYQKNLPQNLAMKIVEAGAQSLPFTTGAIVTSLFNPVAGFIFSAGTMAGTEYMDLMEMGAEHETATVVSSIAGALEGIIEVELGNVAGALGSKVTGSKASELVRRNVIDKVTKSVAEKMHYSGGWRVITNLLMRYGLENLEEGAEEAAQESISLFAKHIVNSVDKLGLESMSVKEIADDLKENFMGGLYGSILLGSGNLLMNSIATKADYDAVKKAAEVIPSEKSFAKAVENNKAFAEMNEETKAQTIHEVYQKYQSKRDADLQKKAESLSEVISADENMESYEAETDENGNELEAPEVPAETRDEKGKLYSQQDEVTENEDGTYSGRKVYGDATKQEKNQYGYISYTVDEDNGTVTIDDFKTNKYRQYLNNEMFADFAADFADYNIVWNAQLEDAKKWKSEIEALNPRGKENGLNYFTNKNLSEEEKRDQQTRQRLVRELGQNFNINGEQKAFTVAMIEAMAKSQGKSISAWVSEKFLDSGIMGDIEDLKKAAYQESINRNEEIEVNGGMALIDTVKGVKAIIYAAEGADLSTALHEFSHVWTKGLTGELEAEAANVFGATKNKDGTYNWDAKVTLSNGREISAYENLAYSYEKWLETGKAPTPQHENIFRKFAEFMKNCVKSLRSAIKLKPETEEFFNKYFSVTDGMVKTAEKAVIEEEANNASDVNSPSVEDLVNGSGIAEENITKSQENLTETEQTVKQTKLDPVTQEAVSSILEDPEIPADKKVAAVVKANGEAFVMKQENIEYYKNRTDLTEEERAQAVKDLEENNDTDRAGTGIPNSLLKSGKSMLFQIIGEKGAQALDEANEETFRMDNRKIAEEMENAGKDAKTILMATGWQKGADGEWKYEISDIKIKPNPIFQTDEGDYKLAKLSDVIDADEIFKAYPQLKDTILQIQKLPLGLQGNYTEQDEMFPNGIITISNSNLRRENPEFTRLYEDFKNTNPDWKEYERKEAQYDNDEISASDFLEWEKNTWRNTEGYKYYNDLLMGRIVPRMIDGLTGESTIAHELQHAIQYIEGFATGGSPESLTAKTYNSLIDDLAPIYAEIGSDETLQSKIKAYKKANLELDFSREDILDQMREAESIKDNDPKLTELWNKLQDISKKYNFVNNAEIEPLFDFRITDIESSNAREALWRAKRLISERSKEDYHNLAGEVESRNVQDRLEMTAEERREQLLEDTEDVTRKDQIVTFDAVEMASIEAEYEEAEKEVKYDGNFVLTKDGKKDFGEITSEIGKAIGRQAGKIRLEIGEQSKNENKGYGEKHFQRAKRIKNLKDAGYNTARDFVEDVSKDYDAIYQGQGTTLVIVKIKNGLLAEYISLKPAEDNDFYTVETGLKLRSDYFKNKEPLWINPNGSMASMSGTAQSFQTNIPRANLGNIDTINVNGEISNVNNPSILFQEEIDKEYEEAVKNGEKEKAIQMLQKKAEENGYLKADYFGNGSWAAPTAVVDNAEDFSNLDALQEYIDDYGGEVNVYGIINGIQGHDENYYFDPSRAGFHGQAASDTAQVYRKLRYDKAGPDTEVTVYRAVPNDINGGKLMRGDWIALSKNYCEEHGKGRYGEGNFHIIEEKVAIKNIWQGEEDMREFGFDDGKSDIEKNVSNNRKLLEITYDDNGNLIPLSQRFNEQNPSILFQEVYHGSGADFDKFDTETYGLSGEGSMAFGYGTYVSGSRDIAEDYAERQRPESDVPTRYKGKEANYTERNAYIRLNQNDFNIDEAIKAIEDDIEWAEAKIENGGDKKWYDEYIEEDRKQIELLKSPDFDINNYEAPDTKSKLYTVEIPDEGFIKWDDFVDYDTVNKAKESLFNYLIENDTEESYAGKAKEFLKKELDYAFHAQMDGKTFYQTISSYLGSDKKTSELLKADGINGIDYPAGTHYGNGNGARNYVIFDDDDAKIINKIYFQETINDDILNTAAGFENWVDFMEYMQDVEPDAVPEEAASDWYLNTWEIAHNASPTSAEREAQVMADREEQNQNEKKDPVFLDGLFLHEIQKEGNLENFLKLVNKVSEISEDEINQLDEEDRGIILNELKKIDTVLSHPTIVNARKALNSKNELKPGHRERIISLMRGRIRDYRAVYADITGRTEYAVEQNESLDAELAARARRFNLITYDSEVENMSPEQKRALEKYVKDKEVLKKFKEDKVKMDDPDVEHYISMLEAQVKSAEKNLKDARNEFQDDMEALGSMQMRDIIKQYHDFLQQKSEADYRKVALPAGTKKALRLGEKAERQQQSGMRQNYNTLAANWDTFKTELAANIKTEERLRSEGKMQEILERYKKNYDATRSETVQELMKKAESLITLKKNHGDVLNELYAVRQLKDQRKALVKRAMRRVNFSTIDYEQAKKIIAIQKVFELNLHGGVNKWIGTEKAMAREVWTAWVTDEVAQEKILNRLSLKGKTDLIKLLEDTKTEEDFEKWTSKQQKDLEKAMPMKDWVKALNLDAWKEERDGALQLDIKPVTRTRYETQKDGSKKAVQYEAVEMSSEVEEMLINAIGMDMTYAIQNRKFDSWTTGEMIELTKKINKLFKEGRDKLEAKRQAEKMESDLLRELIRQNIKDTGIVINPDDPEDVKKKKQAKINKILGIEHAFPGTEASRKEKEQTWLDRVLHGYHDANVRRVARILDNYDERAATNLLYFRENDCFNKEQRAIDRRNTKIEKVIEDNKLDIRKLGQVSEFYGSKFTVDEILMLHAAVMNQNDFYAEQLKDDPSLKPEQAEKESAWQAIVYGNLITPEEREKFRKMDNEVLEKEKERLDSLHAAELAGDKDKIEKYKVREASTVDLNGNLILTGTEALKTLAESRLNGIIFETQNIKNEFKPLIDAIRADYASEFDNINKISIEEFNAPVWREKWYLPLVRLTAAGDTHEQRLKQDLLGHTAGTGKAGTEKGFTKKRIKIGPLNQAPVELGLYKTWADSVERNEHFVAYAGLVREYNRVFDSRDALGMMQDIENRYGHAMTDYIKSYIKEVANPKLMEPKKGLDKVMHIMRGNTAPAYLGWKFSSILKQGIESPAPFMQFVNPAEYMHAAIKMATDKNTRESIERKSAFMKSRVFDPMVDLINENVEKSFNKPGYVIKKFQQVGMSGLEWIDWACVAPGWLAVYDKEYRKLQETEQNRYEARVAELTEQNETRNGKFRMTEEQIKQQAMDDVAQDIEEAAVLKADDCVRLCQPSNRNVDLAPMFKNNSEAAKAVLQFQTALNVIWQNIRYDIPYAMRKKEWKQVVGMILGYVMAGVMSGVVCSGLLKDDDEPEDTAKRLGYYATTQFLDSVPIVGGNLERLAERAITGEGGPMFGSSLWPTFDKYYNAASAFIKEDYEKALKNMTQGLAISLGLPLSGTKEAAALLGIGDGDGELELNPGALAGRRD